MSFVDSFLIPGIGLGELIHIVIMIAIVVMLFFMDNFLILAIGMTRIMMALLIMVVLMIMVVLIIMMVLLIMLVLQGGDGEQFWGEQARISSLVSDDQHIGEAAGSLHCC